MQQLKYLTGLTLAARKLRTTRSTLNDHFYTADDFMLNHYAALAEFLCADLDTRGNCVTPESKDKEDA